ncbi:hypothetical protein [Gymnodinialimonas hymeniacidonis]|uniref:hypothetical protein n=1 Tax=Gymnodinialimonas hymeniacidonis TaxID=3126508 RepID=UPI0034C5DD65
MASRTIIRAHGSALAAVIAAMVFGGLAVFGLRIVAVAVSLGELALWVWVLLGVSLLLLWAVLHALWSAFGVAMVISPDGLRRPGPIRGWHVAAEDGLRVGRYDTVRSNFGSGPSTRLRATKTTEIWALSPTRGAFLMWDGPRGADEVARIEMAIGLHLGLEVEKMTGQGAPGFD